METTGTSEPLARRIVQQLQAAGHIAYYAGGCVRDRVMNRTPTDYDVTTSARPEQVLKLFPRSQHVGVAFGVVLVRGKGSEGGGTVEVATFRAEGKYLDGRHPESVTFTTPEHDAQRRDFTCNGLFYDPLADKLLDYVGGLKDIEAKTLRAIGDPAQRFAEDHLRLLRAIRFAAKLDFAIDPATWDSIRRLAPQLATISRERIGEEIRLMLEHPTRPLAARLLQESTLLPIIWPPPLLPPAFLSASPRPRVPASSSGPWPLTPNPSVLARLPNPVSRPLALAALQLNLGLPANLPWPGDAGIADLLRQAFMLSNTETDDLAFLGEKLPVLQSWKTLRVAAFKRLLADPRWPALAALFHAATPDPAVQSAFAQRLAALSLTPHAPPPFVTGNDLIALGAAPGPNFKRRLDDLYDRQLENQFPTREAALAAARALLHPPKS